MNGRSVAAWWIRSAQLGTRLARYFGHKRITTTPVQSAFSRKVKRARKTATSHPQGAGGLWIVAQALTTSRYRSQRWKTIDHHGDEVNPASLIGRTWQPWEILRTKRSNVLEDSLTAASRTKGRIHRSRTIPKSLQMSSAGSEPWEESIGSGANHRRPQMSDRMTAAT